MHFREYWRMFSKLDESPKISLTPLAYRVEQADALLPLPDLGRLRGPGASYLPRSRPVRRVLLNKLAEMRLTSYYSLRTSRYELHHTFPGTGTGAVSAVLRNPRSLRYLQSCPNYYKNHSAVPLLSDAAERREFCGRDMYIDFARLFPAPPAPRTLFSNFVRSGDTVLRYTRAELVRTMYGDLTHCRDITHPVRPFDADIGRDRFVRAAVEFTKAANYVYYNRNDPNLDIMRISVRVAVIVYPELSDAQYGQLLDLVLVSLTKIQLRK